MLRWIARAMPLNSTRLKFWSLSCFFKSPSTSLGSYKSSSEATLLLWTKYPIYESRHTQQQHKPLNKALTVWSCFIATTAKQRVTSTGDPGSYTSVSLYFTSLWQSTMPLKQGFKSCDLLHLICKLGWAASELTFSVWFMQSWLSLCYLVFHFEYWIERAEADGCERLSPSSNGKTAGGSDPGYTPWNGFALFSLSSADTRN